MGYYTRHKLEVLRGNVDNIRQAYRDKTGLENFDGETKFYDEGEVSIEVSALHPDAIFIVSGAGGEPGDIWRKIYFDGQCLDSWRLGSEHLPIPQSVLALLEPSQLGRMPQNPPPVNSKILEEFDSMKKFTQKLELRVETIFNNLDEGDCFTVPGDAGFGQIWVGFPVWMKLDLGNARSIEDGRKKCFKSTDRVIKVQYGSINKPEGT